MKQSSIGSTCSHSHSNSLDHKVVDLLILKIKDTILHTVQTFIRERKTDQRDVLVVTDRDEMNSAR